MKQLSKNFITELLKKADKEQPKVKNIFNDEERKSIRTAIRTGQTTLVLRDRDFVLRFFVWRKENWVTLRPVKGFVPMISGPVKDLLVEHKEL